MNDNNGSIVKNFMINPFVCIFRIEGHAVLDINQEPRYNTLLLRLIPEDLYSVCHYRQFHTLHGILDSHNQAALPNSYPNPCMPSKEAVCTIFMMVFGMTLPRCKPMTFLMRGDKLTNKSSQGSKCFKYIRLILLLLHYYRICTEFPSRNY